MPLIGTLMDMAQLIPILPPAPLAVTNALDINLVHFGMIMFINLGIGPITPPVGSVLFGGSSSICPQYSMTNYVYFVTSRTTYRRYSGIKSDPMFIF